MDMVVDYDDMKLKARDICEKGKDANKEFAEAYASIANMHSSWYGKRYNSLATDFNNMIPLVNELLEVIVGELPYALENAANNYILADTGEKRVAKKETPSKITSLLLSNDVGAKFELSGVKTIQNSVSNNFQRAKDKMNEIEATYQKIVWQGSAAESMKAKFTKLKNNIIQSIDNINSNFTKLMNQASEDMQSAEKSNTVQ